MADAVEHPPHYTAHPSGVECITVTEHMGFNLGNAVKYIWRADEKGKALEDLRKAAWYVQREIAKREAAEVATVITDGTGQVVATITDETATVAIDADNCMWVVGDNGWWASPGKRLRSLAELRRDYGPLELAVDGRPR